MNRFCNRRRIIYLIIIGISTLNVAGLKAQIPTIKYDFQNSRIDSILPFDQRFNIELINVDSTLDFLKVSFIPVPPTKKLLNQRIEYKGKKVRLKEVTPVITNDTLLKYSQSPILEVGYAFDKTPKNISVPFQLRHNQDYLVVFTGRNSCPLTEPERLELKSKLTISVNLFLDSLIANISNVGTQTTLNGMLFDFLKKANEQVLETNDRYIISDSEQKLIFYKYQNYFVDFYLSYENAREDAIVNNPEKYNLFRKINWGNDTLIMNSVEEIKKLAIVDSNAYWNERMTEFENNIQSVIKLRNKMIEGSNEIIEKVFIQLISVESLISPTYSNSLTKNASFYYTLDLGYIYNYYIDDFFPSLTMTLYFRPVNPNLPFSHYSGWDKVFTRTGLIAGTTLASVKAEGKRKGIIGDNGIILGIGYRFLPFIKGSVGTLVIKADDPNPIVEDYKVKFTLYFGISIDCDIAKTIKNAFNSYD